MAKGAKTMGDEGKLMSAAVQLDWLADVFWTVPDGDVAARFPVVDAEGLPDVTAEARAVACAAGGLDGDAASEVMVEATSLFYGFDASAPFPYESVYTGEGRLLAQAASEEVKADYDGAGIDPVAERPGEPADHLSYELRFLAVLARRMADALGSGDAEALSRAKEAKDRFCAGHASRWVPEFAMEVASRAETGFFRAVAPYTTALVAAVAEM